MTLADGRVHPPLPACTSCPKGFHRIRHYGLFANGSRAANIAQARELLAVPPRLTEPDDQKAAEHDEPRIHASSLPVLRRPHDHHRDLRARLPAELSADARAAADQDRHLMRRLSRRIATDPLRWLAAGNNPTCLMPPAGLTAPPEIAPTQPFARILTDALAGCGRCRQLCPFPSAPQQGSNPHRASLTAGASPPAISCLGASRTPSDAACHTVTSRRPRNLFLMHVLPRGFHRIRHYGLFASSNRATNIARARELLGAASRVVEPAEEKAPDEPRVLACPAPAVAAK